MQEEAGLEDEWTDGWYESEISLFSISATEATRTAVSSLSLDHGGGGRREPVRRAEAAAAGCK